MPENKLEIIVRESGLEATKANTLLEQFKDYFQIAAEWEAKAKTIIVTNETQTADMQMARVGRLFLRDKRIAIEKTRLKLKADIVREGKAIDGISNVLKALIVPIEEYLGNQEKFVENKIKAEVEQKRIEAEKKAEEERIAKEKAEAAEQERIRKENEQLKKEAEKREHEIAAERAKAEADRKAIEDKARIERERQEKIIADQKAKAEADRKEAAEKLRIAEEAKRKAEEQTKDLIECPYCHKKFTLTE